MSEKIQNEVKISFVVPCFNEEANIIPTIETILAAVEGRMFTYEILVIDDGSTDSTRAMVEEYMREHPKVSLQLHSNGKNCGLGYNYMKGVELARGEYYMCVFGDHSEPVEQLQAILNEMGKYDMVIPYLDQKKLKSWVRYIISHTFTFIVNLLSGNKLKYYNASVLHKRSNLLKLKNVGRGYGYQAEILCQLLRNGSSYIELFVPANRRMQGRSKAFRISNLVSVGGSLYKILKTRMGSMK